MDAHRAIQRIGSIAAVAVGFNISTAGSVQKFLIVIYGGQKR